MAGKLDRKDSLPTAVKFLVVMCHVDIVTKEEPEPSATSHKRLNLLQRGWIEPRHIEQVDRAEPVEAIQRRIPQELDSF